MFIYYPKDANIASVLVTSESAAVFTAAVLITSSSAVFFAAAVVPTFVAAVVCAIKASLAAAL